MAEKQLTPEVELAPKPDIFLDKSLAWVAFGMTLRPENPDPLDDVALMTGNVRESLSMLEESYWLLKTRGWKLDPYDGDRLGNIDAWGYEASKGNQGEMAAWCANQALAARFCVAEVRDRLSIRRLLQPVAEHGLTLHDADNETDYKNAHGGLVRRNRLRGDAGVASQVGSGVLIDPADCLAACLVHAVGTRRREIALIHAGFKGLAHNILGTTMTFLNESRDWNPANTLVYLPPHASSGYTIDTTQGEFAALAAENKHGLIFGPEIARRKEFMMAKTALGQLERARVKPDHIETSKVNVLSDDDEDGGYFSHRGRHKKAVTGRNGVFLGIREQT